MDRRPLSWSLMPFESFMFVNILLMRGAEAVALHPAPSLTLPSPTLARVHNTPCSAEPSRPAANSSSSTSLRLPDATSPKRSPAASRSLKTRDVRRLPLPSRCTTMPSSAAYDERRLCVSPPIDCTVADTAAVVAVVAVALVAAVVDADGGVSGGGPGSDGVDVGSPGQGRGSNPNPGQAASRSSICAGGACCGASSAAAAAAIAAACFLFVSGESSSACCLTAAAAATAVRRRPLVVAKNSSVASSSPGSGM